MATTEELLAQLENNPEMYAEESQELVIDAETRTINIPASETLFGVKGDKNIERKYFRCPRIVGDNVDLSTHLIYIAYVYTESNSGSIFPSIGIQPYHCDDVEIDGDNITFSWQLSDHVFQSAGFIAFKMYAKEKEDSPYTVFNTAPAIGTVLYTIGDGVESVVSEHPDIINQLLAEMESVQEIATPEAMQGYVNAYLEENPVTGGMTEEQKQQLNKNTEDISSLSEDINNMWSDVIIGELFEDASEPVSGLPYKTDGLDTYVDFTHFPDGFPGKFGDLSENNTEVVTAGTDLYTSGRNGMVGGKFMVNGGPLSNSSGSRIAIESEAIHAYPFSVEMYVHLRRNYNPYAGNNVLTYENTGALQNYQCILFSTQYNSSDGTGGTNGVKVMINKEKVAISGSANSPNVSKNVQGLEIDGIQNENIGDRYDHIVVCFDSNKQKFYLNNKLIIDNDEKSVSLTMSSVLRILPDQLKGDIKLIRIYEGMLSDEDVEMNYLNAVGGTEDEI